MSACRWHGTCKCLLTATVPGLFGALPLIFLLAVSLGDWGVSRLVSGHSCPPIFYCQLCSVPMILTVLSQLPLLTSLSHAHIWQLRPRQSPDQKSLMNLHFASREVWFLMLGLFTGLLCPTLRVPFLLYSMYLGHYVNGTVCGMDLPAGSCTF